MLRRHCIIGAAAAAALFPAMPVIGQTDSAALSLVEQLVGEINRVIASGKSQGAMSGDFERIFRRFGDVPSMAAYALGVDGRDASVPQKRAFEDAFVGYLSRKYGSRFRDFAGGTFEVESATPVKSFHEVAATVQLPEGAPVGVEFVVSDRGGRARFFNIKIGGDNLLLIERTEIGVMIDRHGGDIDAVIRDLSGAG